MGSVLPLGTFKMEEIYSRNVDTVYRVCFSFMKNRADTEDIVQETFLKLLDRKISFQSPEHERAWLIVTASNLCKNALKHWWRRHEDIDALETAAQGYDPETAEAVQAIMALPPDYKLVVYMYYYEGYSTPEIARFTGMKQATVRSKLHRAREKLKKSLEGGADHEAQYSKGLSQHDPHTGGKRQNVR